MTPEIWAATIAAVPATLAALAAWRAGRHAKAARTQVENNHQSNLREDLDVKHTDNTTALASIGRTLRSVVGTQRAIVADVRTIRTIVDRHSEQIWELEKTQPATRKGGK